MTLDDVRRIQVGPTATGWDQFEETLCRAADELHSTSGVSNVTWTALAERYDDRQMTEAVMTVGYYHLVAFVINSLGVPLEAGAEGFSFGRVSLLIVQLVTN